jgi:hypothetical protein
MSEDQQPFITLPTDEELRAQVETGGAGMKPVYDFGFIGGMSRLLAAHGRIGKAMKPSARCSPPSPPRPRTATTERSLTQSFCVSRTTIPPWSRRSSGAAGASCPTSPRGSARSVPWPRR